MRCFIIDDEAYSIDTLSNYVKESGLLELSGTSTNPVIGLNTILKEDKIDVLFLDVDMPGLTGIEIAGLIPKSISVIFCTAHPNYALNAFELQAQDFLLKPVSFTRFLQALNKIIIYRQNAKHERMKETGQDGLFINPGVKGKFVQLHIENIIYVEGLKNYVLIHADHKSKHITYLGMNEIQQALPGNIFLRVHKSYIVNRMKIASVEGNIIKMENHAEIPIGSTYKDTFFNEISKFILQSKRRN